MTEAFQTTACMGASGNEMVHTGPYTAPLELIPT